MVSRQVPTLELPQPVPWAVPREPLRLSRAWTISLLFGGLFLWWMLGLGGFVQALLALPMLVFLVHRGRIKFPRAFLLWIFFIVWMFVTAVHIQTLGKWVSFVWRGGLYIAAGILFVYLFNATREEIPTRKIVKLLAGFWVMTVVGGVIGMVLPTVSFRTPFEILLPQTVVAEQFVYDLVHASTAALHAFGFTSIHRPKAPFIYTNQWGSAFALTLPFAIAAVPLLRSWLWRKALLALLVLSVIPLVVSLDRGSWLSAVGSIGYATIRLSGGRDRRAARAARALLVAGTVAIVIVLMSPLWGLIQLRLSSGYGDQTRALLYESAIQAVSASPILGYGTPISISQVNPTAPQVALSVGTHGQFWTVLVSHGIPGTLLFGGWFAFVFAKSARRVPSTWGRDGNSRFWAHVAIVAGLIQMPYYELLPWGLPIMMVAAALAWREARPDPRAQPLPVRATRGALPAPGAPRP